MDKPLRHIDLSTPAEAQQHEVTLETLASFIRRVYVAEMRQFSMANSTYGNRLIPQWDGGEDQHGTRHKPIWPKLAVFIVERRVNPLTFIHIQFAASRGRKPPLPTMLATELALQRYYTYQSTIDEELRAEFARQQRSLSTQLLLLGQVPDLTPEQRLQMSLQDQRVDANSLFRYCRAVAANLPQLAAKYHDAALTIYLFERAHYDVAWGASVIPEVLRQEATALLDRLGLSV